MRTTGRPHSFGADGPPNEGMKLTKPEYLGGRRYGRPGVIESGFAAYAQCSTDLSEKTGNALPA